MKYNLIFHANLHYSNLHPDMYEFVIRHSYERVLNLFNNKYPQAGWVFEASGYTLEQIAKVCPDVFEKLKDAFRKNCEFMGSPYAHSILANFPYEDGLHSLEIRALRRLSRRFLFLNVVLKFLVRIYVLN